MTTEANRGWANSPLTIFLTDLFPGHRTKNGRLAVYDLAKDVGRTAASIYTWLADGKLSVANSQLLLRAATTDSNIAALRAAGRRSTPKIEEFLPFFLA